MRIAYYSFLNLAILAMAFSCDKPISSVISEEFTSIKYTLTPSDGVGVPVTLYSNDPDGLGGKNPTIIIDTLLKNKSYNGILTLFDESISPTKEVTYVIEDMQEDFQFFYLPIGTQINVEYNDVDLRGDPIGVETTLLTGDTNDSLRIILKLRPDKGGPDVSKGKIENAGGVTELDVSFPILLQ